MSDNNEKSEEPVSRLNSIQRISAAYQSMYAQPEPETEIENEEDKNVTPT
jgi:hypothetical protein